MINRRRGPLFAAFLDHAAYLGDLESFSRIVSSRLGVASVALMGVPFGTHFSYKFRRSGQPDFHPSSRQSNGKRSTT
jgi:hypothetical protein